MSYKLEIAGPAARTLEHKLPEKVATAVIEFMLGPLKENPQRVGAKLRNELTGLYSARRGSYRVIYRIDEDNQTVFVVDISHRSSAYHSS